MHSHGKCLLKHVIERKKERKTRSEDEEEFVSCCWMTLRKKAGAE
jgi:hypothetical protein